MSTNTFAKTLAVALQTGDPNTIANALAQYGLGQHLSPQKWAFSTSPGATAWVLSGATAAAGASAGAKTPALPQGQTTLPAALVVGTLRVTSGVSGAAGPYLVTDQGGTPQNLQLSGPSGAQVLDTPGVATLSDDGTTITFASAVTGFIIEYIPRSLKDVTSAFESS